MQTNWLVVICLTILGLSPPTYSHDLVCLSCPRLLCPFPRTMEASVSSLGHNMVDRVFFVFVVSAFAVLDAELLVYA